MASPSRGPAALEVFSRLAIGVGVASGLFEVDVNVEGNEFLCVDVIGHVRSGAALSTRADGVDA
jgi:hypothetical protein